MSTIIDEDGWEIGVFNVPLGRPMSSAGLFPSPARDSSQAGPFDWIGNVNLQVPSQNISD